MKIFTSWSGKRSNHLAKALKELLPDVIQEADVWMSEHDIQAGTRWSQSLSITLSQCNIGIACLTPENLLAPWLLFEAGAITKSVEDGRFIPLLLDLEPSQVKPPLSQFQLVKADILGFSRIVESLNSVAQSPLPPDRLKRQIERCWPDLSARIDVALKLPSDSKPLTERSDSDILKELLSLARAATRHEPSPETVSIWIDPRPLDPPLVEPFELQMSPTASVSDLLDTIWFTISTPYNIPAFTYGEKWLLKNERTDEVIRDIGRRYIRSKGKDRDNRPILLLNLRPEDVLLVIDPKDAKG